MVLPPAAALFRGGQQCRGGHPPRSL